MTAETFEARVDEDEELGEDTPATQARTSPAPEGEGTSKGGVPQSQRYYDNAEHWVTEWLIPHYCRDVRQKKWDPHWFRYPEVVTVFEGLWDLWESARADSPGAITDFMRVQLYPLMSIITATDGPFWEYEEALGQTHPPERWKIKPAPEGMFRPRDHPEEQA